MSDIELLPCAHCGDALTKRQHSAFHPPATVGKPWCWLSTAGEFGGCYELVEGNYEAWNRRASDPLVGELEGALEFFADPHTSDPSVWKDARDHARALLAKVKT